MVITFLNTNYDWKQHSLITKLIIPYPNVAKVKEVHELSKRDAMDK